MTGNITITKFHKNIIIAAAIVGLLFVLFLVLVYLPSKNKINKLNAEIFAVQAEISRIRSGLDKNKSMEQNIIGLNEKLKDINVKLPPKEEIILRELTDAAKKFGIEVVSMSPEKKKVVTDIDGSPVRVKDYFVKEMSVSMTAKTYYKKLGDFLIYIRENFPVAARVKDVSMSGSASGADADSGLLSVNLKFDTYMLSTSAE